MAWERDVSGPTELMREVASFHAGRSGLLIVREDASLWRIDTDRLWGFGEKIATGARRLAADVRTAAVGDSANYYVDRQGRLFVKGRAHRGQYGDGRLTATDTYVQTFDRVVQVVSHTGHTLVLREDGSVWGTGGNIYGPLGRHGYGDKADRWGRIFDDARAIATGSSHSLAIRNDASLWIWGRDESLEPRQVLSGVAAVAAGNRGSIALARGYLWYWETGAEPDRIMPCGE